MTSQNSNSWLHKVETALIKSQQLPLLDEGFSFPWQQLSSALETLFSIKEMKLSSHSSSLKTGEALSAGMGNEPVVFNFELSPIAGTIQWIMSSEDVSTLTAQCLTLDQKSESFSDHKLKEGFYQFLLLEAVQAIDQLKVFKETSLHLLSSKPLLQEEAVCIDVAVLLPAKTLYGRLACPQSFLDAFKIHQPSRRESFLMEEKVKQFEVSLHLKAGSVVLDPEEWKSVMPGDFIVLDSCSYDPETQKGSVTLMLGADPLLRGRLKPEGIKILEYASYFEETLPSDALGEEESSSSTEEIESYDGVAEEEMETAITAQKPSITLSIEVGYVRMTIEKLLELLPDTLLDLTIQPEQGVDISINGKQIGKGEIIKLSDLLGLRLLDIKK